MSDTSKTVGLLIPSFLPNLGGMEVGLHNIALRVQALGWEPIVFAPYEHVKKLKEKNWTLPYKVVPLPPKSWGLITRIPLIGFKIMDLYLAHMQKKHGINFWHVTMGYPTGCAMVHYANQSKQNVQYLIRCAGEDIQRQPDIGYGLRLDPKFDKVISHHLSQAQRLVAITPSVYNEYKELNIPDERIYNIPNGVAIDRFTQDFDREAIRAKLGVGQDDTLILSIGRNHPKKNYKTLIEAGAHLKKHSVQDFKIVCVGNGCDNLAEHVDALGLSDHAVLINGMSNPDESNIALPVEALVQTYRAADIFAFPSLTETFGIAIVEAMAAGLPVIVGDSQGCRDIVERGKWGLMCDPNNAEDLAQKIMTVMTDNALKDNLIAKSHQRAKDFDWNNIAKKYVEIYETSQKP
ncbi:MAG: glycosyltransferase family 4 protein [Alphaproteobacteria bacterium]